MLINNAIIDHAWFYFCGFIQGMFLVCLDPQVCA